MKKYITLFLLIPFITQAQMWGFFPPVNVLDNSPSNNISFMYSFRKVRNSYFGYCFRARRTDNNAQVDVAFDGNNKTSNASNCVVSTVGTSSYTFGQTMTWSDFVTGAPQVRLSVWYDQSNNGRHAIQGTSSAQPQIVGYQNGLFYLQFTSNENIYSPYASNVLLAANGTVQGVDGSFFLVATPSTGVNPSSFGYLSGTNVRWSAHLNWTDGNTYFDAGETCCAGVRFFSNSANNGLWKQYTFQRYNTNKVVRVSGTQKLSGVGNVDSYDANNTNFGIGYINNGIPTTANGSQGHNGIIAEAILFKAPLSNGELLDIENSQMKAWNAY